MKTQARAIFICGVLLLCAVNNGWAIRCGNGIVDTGDTVEQLLSTCGQPDAAHGDVWGDRATLTYKQASGAVYTINILNGKVANIDMSR